MIYELPTGFEFSLTVDVVNDWGTGFVTRVEIANLSDVPLDGWALEFDLADGIAVANSNLAAFSQTGTAVRFFPTAPWLSDIAPGQTANFTFRSNGSVTDALTDIVPSTLIDNGTAFDLGDPAPPPSGFETELVVKSSWGTGAWLQVVVTNGTDADLSDWRLAIDLPPGLDFASSGAVEFVTDPDGQTYLVPTRAALETIAAGDTVTLGFNVAGNPGLLPDLSLGEISGDTPAPTPGDLETELVVKSTFGSGAWLQAVVTNDTADAVSDWRLAIDLPAGLSFASSGTVEFVTDPDGQTYLVPKQASLQTIAVGDTIALGFNVAGDPALVSQIVLGEVTGATPPSAVNDTITDYAYDPATGILSIDAADVLANDSAADGSDVSLVSARTVAGGGGTSIEGDTIRYTVNPTETGRVVLSYTIADGQALTNSGQIFVDLPTAPTLIVGDVTVDEADGTAAFAVTLSGPLALSDVVQVDYSTRERSALAGIDFVAAAGTLQFTQPGTQTVTVSLVDDSAAELTETFEFLLANATGARIEGDAGVATVNDDAGDTGPLGLTTAGLDIDVSLAGEFVVGHTFALSITNDTGSVLTQSPLVTVGVQDGMKLVTNTGADYSPASGPNVTQDGQAAVVASHDDRYYTFAVNPRGDVNADLADGTWDPGDTATVELFFRGSHFFKPLAERIEIAPAVLEAEAPERPFVPLDLTYKGFNTTFFNRSDVTEADVAASFQEQSDLGANSIAIVTTHFMDDKDSTLVRATDFTMTDEDLVSSIREAKLDGLDVLLKPHIDLESGQFRGRLLNTAGPNKVDEFFGRQEDGSYADGSYGELIMRYAEIAQTEGVDILLIGTELVDLAKNRANLPFWEQLIEDVRGVYTGDLSYATIVGEELFVRFWDDLDYISLDIYPPLTDTSSPSVGELVDGWTETPTTERGLEAYFNLAITDLISEMSQQYGKKVLITETGFRSVDGIAARPFDFELQGFADLQEQVDAYESFFIAAQESMGDFLDGVFLWEYPNEPAAPDGTVEQAFGYTPQNKPVYDLIGDFFDFA